MRHDVVRSIEFLFRLDRKLARASYAEHFGRPCDDPTVDRELYDLFRNRNRVGVNVTVPEGLVLALIMRTPPGKGHGKKRPPLEPMKRGNRNLVVGAAEKIGREASRLRGARFPRRQNTRGREGPLKKVIPRSRPDH